MSPTVVGALGCALSFTVVWWLRRASAVCGERDARAAECADLRAQLGASV